MKKDPLKIYIDRLKDDDTEQIFEVLESDFLETNEEELSFTGKVTISGQAYLAKNHLILDLKIKATANMPCSICNEKSIVSIEVDDFTHTVELCEIQSAIYDFADEVKSSLLIKIPQFHECNSGKCPHRKDVTKFLKDSSEENHSPFSELTLYTPPSSKTNF
ncbi:MAG: hypothetical protein K940chlam6_01347 [Chlamydiae bacterium]|nr:hypothetical protein [Chlamydiota bacterium]